MKKQTINRIFKKPSTEKKIYIYIYNKASVYYFFTHHSCQIRKLRLRRIERKILHENLKLSVYTLNEIVDYIESIRYTFTIRFIHV